MINDQNFVKASYREALDDAGRHMSSGSEYSEVRTIPTLGH